MQSNVGAGSLDGFIKMLDLISEKYEIFKGAANNISSNLEPPMDGGPESLETILARQLKDVFGEKSYNNIKKLYQAYQDMLNV
jgi:hypothetical protein